MRVAVVANLCRPLSDVAAAQLAEQLAAASADLVVLPELPWSPWLPQAARYDDDAWRDAQEAHDAGLATFIDWPTAVVTTVPAVRDGRRRNQPVVVTGGDVVTVGPGKAWLPDLAWFHETTWFDPAPVADEVVTVDGVRIGVLPCSDLWCQDRVRTLAAADAHLIATPRVTFAAAAERWRILGTTTALLGGVYWASATSAGDGGEHGSIGGAAWIVDPGGAVAASVDAEGQLATATISRRAADNAKTTYPRSLYLRP